MLYRILHFIVKIFMYILGIKVEGSHNLPSEGPVIVAANHVSNWDPIVVAISLRRPVHFMAKSELFDKPFLGSLLKVLYAFPVKRGSADRTAIRHALALLEQGEVVGIFPEGERNKAGVDLEAQSGVAMLALKSGTPVVPVACIGTNRTIPFGWFSPFIVRIGEPIYVEKKRRVNSAMMKELSAGIMTKIKELS
ncbi:MAG TPA: 1-acyl-sn-glycerol-3-phosphate acyltransferase [Syntrophomonadaceae bacterium]|nr:1-acyl-sn-glycerol-3-phosphate acyltransferase [Syntrophomonadaceae bacterium]